MSLKWEDLKVGMVIKNSDGPFKREVKFVGTEILVTQRLDDPYREYAWGPSEYNGHIWTEVKPTVKRWYFLFQPTNTLSWYNNTCSSIDNAVAIRKQMQDAGYKVSEVKEVEFEV